MSAGSKLLEELRRVGSDLPADLVERIAALGREATPLLLTLLETSGAINPNESADAGACAECGMPHEDQWARLHAVDILSEMRDPDAIEAMLRLLDSAPPDDPIRDKIVERFPLFGGAATEPILGALARTSEGTASAEVLCCILSSLGVRDDRILQALLALLVARPRAGAVYLSEYGDPAACPALLDVIVASIADEERATTRAALPDLALAYTSLGGELPTSIRAKIDAAPEP
jgi:HEAT repeat protein